MRASDYKKLNDRKAELTRITLTEKDGTETVIDLDDNLHHLFTFTRAKVTGDGHIPLEIVIRGNIDVSGEMFYEPGEAQSSIIEHCARRAFQKILEQLKAQGVDPIEEAFKVVPVVGGIQ